MKALHIFERIFHYVKIWLFILAVLFVAMGLSNAAGLVVVDDVELTVDTLAVADALGVDSVSEGFAIAYALNTAVGGLGAMAFLLVIGSIVMWAFEHTFKMIQVIRARDVKCECCKEEEGDAQVEKIMKWKDFYNEGIITEREFIQKRNEILGLHK